MGPTGLSEDWTDFQNKILEGISANKFRRYGIRGQCAILAAPEEPQDLNWSHFFNRHGIKFFDSRRGMRGRAHKFAIWWSYEDASLVSSVGFDFSDPRLFLDRGYENSGIG